VSRFLHEGELMKAALVLHEFSKCRKPDGPKSAQRLCWSLVDWCLQRDHYADAALLLWTPTMFTPLPRSTQMIWDALDGYSTVLLMGASSMSKSYSSGVYFFLDWLRDPEFTTCTVIGPTEDHLKRNLFSHLTRLHMEASLPVPGVVGDLFIGLSRRDTRGGLSGVVMPRGPKAAGKLQGSKRFQRSRPHPVFGEQSRLRTMLDEIENIPGSVWSDLDNLTSNIDAEEDGVEGLKIVGAFNPKEISGPVAARAEPEKGWKNVDLDKDEIWSSRRGWRVVRLDAEKSENVIEGKVIYSGLQTKRGLEILAKSTGGVDSAGYLTFGRAMFPEESMSYAVIPPTTLHEWEGEFVWADKPRRVAGVDLALEGGDPAVAAIADFGSALGVKYPASPEHPEGRTVMFVDERGKPIRRVALGVMHIRRLAKGDTMKMARQIIDMCKIEGIMPPWLMLDRTGNGAGVHDVLKTLWSPEVRAINYSESASDLKVLEESESVAKDLYDRVYSEVWFAVGKWTEFGLMKVHPQCDYRDVLRRQLLDRRFDPRSKSRVESKRDWVKRQTEDISPNEADAYGLVLHGVRMESKIVPSGLVLSGGASDDYQEAEIPLPCDVTNLFDDL
jgi:hypothetical protein